MDRGRINRDEFLENWKDKTVSDARPNAKRLNEIFNLSKSRTINDEMNPKQILRWANILLQSFGLVIRSMSGGKYALKGLFDIQGLIERKNSRGKFFIDRENKLKQVLPSEDLFIDEELDIVRSKTNRNNDYDTTMLDDGINME